MFVFLATKKNKK